MSMTYLVKKELNNIKRDSLRGRFWELSNLLSALSGPYSDREKEQMSKILYDVIVGVERLEQDADKKIKKYF